MHMMLLVKLANIPCGGKVTSCPDQLSKAINENIKVNI